ncbi:MAG TPA: hypothetical protein VKA74_11630 [Myxococcota bacterium]|nr:hypothetical protein [Myxococcota bacterium]
MEFDAVAYAHETLAPLLNALCELADSEQQLDQRRFFAGVLSGIECASEAEDLADPFLQLSMSAFMGFSFTAPTALLLDQLLDKAQLLSEALSLDASEIH